MIYIITGFHHERFRARLGSSLGALAGADVRPVVVCQNGLRFGHVGAVVLLSEPGVIPFLDTAFDWLHSNAQPGDWFARVDSDDIYTPEYLPGLRAAVASGADWSGIPHPYLLTQDGLIYCEHLDGSRSQLCSGGTLAGRVDAALPFRFDDGKPYGEDARFCREMAGRSFFARPPVGYAYQKHQGHTHTFPVPNDVLVHAWAVTPYEQPGDPLEAVRRDPIKTYPIEQDVEKACSIRHYLTTGDPDTCPQ